MRNLLLALVITFAAALPSHHSSASAQGTGNPAGGGDGGGDTMKPGGDKPDGPAGDGGQAARQDEGQQGDAEPAEDPNKPMTLDDARSNVGTLITSFVTQRSAQGFMPLRDKRTKKVRKLKLVSVEEKKVKAAGGKRYAAPAKLKDLASGQTLDAVFTVDFTGPEWKVVGMRLLPPATAAAAKTKAKK
jgi:hypothetical protein